MSIDQRPEIIKAIQIKEFNTPYSVSEVQVPKPRPHQILVKIKAGSFCYTNCMALKNAFGMRLPFIGSHEPAGVVVDAGADISRFAAGDCIRCINFESCCRKCPDCKAGRPIYCDDPLMKGLITDSGRVYREACFAVKLPDALAFTTAACLMCAGISIYGAIKRAGVSVRRSIGIVRIGWLGHIGTQLAKAIGYQVVAVDAKQDALDLVSTYDLSLDVTILATDLINTLTEKITQTIKGDYPGLDATILAMDVPPTFDLAAKKTRKHGTMVLLGQPKKGITLSYCNVIFRNIRLVGSLLAERDEAAELFALVAKHNIQVKIKEWHPEDAEEMRQEYLAGKTGGKNVIVCNRDAE